jgi:hypothetical protein
MERRGGDWRRVDEMQDWADRDSWRLQKSTHKCGNNSRKKKCDPFLPLICL